MIALALLLAVLDDKPYFGELRERLESPVIATIESRKPPHDLEVCIANAVSSLGAPVVLRDGPDNVIVAASLAITSQTFFVAVSLTKVEDGTKLEVRLRGKSWDERMKSRVSECAVSPTRFAARS